MGLNGGAGIVPPPGSITVLVLAAAYSLPKYRHAARWREPPVDVLAGAGRSRRGNVLFDCAATSTVDASPVLAVAVLVPVHRVTGWVRI